MQLNKIIVFPQFSRVINYWNNMFVWNAVCMDPLFLCKFDVAHIFLKCIRDHSGITSAKRWVGGVRKWQFLLIYSTIYAEVGLKSQKHSDVILKWSLVETHPCLFRTHWDFLILIPKLILTSFLHIKKVEIYKTEFKLGKNNKIQWKKIKNFQISKFFTT